MVGTLWSLLPSSSLFLRRLLSSSSASSLLSSSLSLSSCQPIPARLDKHGLGRVKTKNVPKKQIGDGRRRQQPQQQTKLATVRTMAAATREAGETAVARPGHLLPPRDKSVNAGMGGSTYAVRALPRILAQRGACLVSAGISSASHCSTISAHTSIGRPASTVICERSRCVSSCIRLSFPLFSICLSIFLMAVATSGALVC
ncbi:hypothetical protein TW95_gp0142 [Pandoravirus inopinatum]|uniref:Uncharacterized protein n=1 Tax=Pandoravirus inopinatum TaxID=1605721 RepID=A0A0B5J7W9_9VIRU|nr:hypothetical protein TW95_gp0142 [Pandoravirus inopinatum]AJF96876.1 hypothetical protein [Pandoravirus inopinatum]